MTSYFSDGCLLAEITRLVIHPPTGPVIHKGASETPPGPTGIIFNLQLCPGSNTPVMYKYIYIQSE